MSIVIGIDPGVDGGIAAIGEQGLTLQIMPASATAKRREIDETELTAWLGQFDPLMTHVFIERVAARPRQGVVAMFSFGTGWGLVRGICAGLRLRYELVRPQEWQRLLLLGQPEGAEYFVAARLWPGISFRSSNRSRKPHSGLVDAALIAEYGRRQLG